MKVEATIEHVTLYNAEDREVASVRAICTRCEKETESFGTGPASIRRCLVLLREGCDEENYYVAENDPDD